MRSRSCTDWSRRDRGRIRGVSFDFYETLTEFYSNAYYRQISEWCAARGIAFTGHGPTIDDPTARARELVAHHHERLDVTRDGVDGTPRTAYDVSLHLFPADLAAVQRRFALAESRAHLEYLALRGEIERVGHTGRTA